MKTSWYIKYRDCATKYKNVWNPEKVHNRYGILKVDWQSVVKIHKNLPKCVEVDSEDTCALRPKPFRIFLINEECQTEILKALIITI